MLFLQCFSINKGRFLFKGCKLASERDEIQKFNQAEIQMAEAVRRLETRRINKIKKLEEDPIKKSEAILDGIRKLFAPPPTNSAANLQNNQLNLNPLTVNPAISSNQYDSNRMNTEE